MKTKKVIKSKELEGMEKLIGHKGPKAAGKPLTDDLKKKLKGSKVA